MLIAAVLGGVAVGSVVGLVGAGGGILAVPILVYLVGLTPGVAVPAALFVTGMSSLTALPARVKQRKVRWLTALAVILTGMPATWLGAYLARGLDPDWLMLLFSGLTITAGLKMLLSGSQRERPSASGLRTLLLGALLGMGIGVLTGVFGVGGGFLIVPALMMVLGFSAQHAAATSLAIIVFNSAAGFLAYLGIVDVPWPVVLTFAGAAMVSSLVASLVAVRLPDRVVQVCFGLLLLGISAWILISTVPNL